MIRVLQIPGTLSRLDGRMSVIMNVYRNLDRSKIQFDFVTSIIGQETYKYEIEKLGGKVYILEKSSFDGMRKIVEKLLQENNYDFLHYHAISPWGCVLDLGKKYGVKVITESHATAFSDKLLKKIRNKIFSMNIIKNSDQLVAVSPEAGRKLFGKNNFKFIPTWVEKDQFKFSLKKRKEIRNKLNLKDSDVLIGHIGRFAIQKNHKFMIKVFKMLMQTDNKYHLALISDGPLKKDIEEYVKKNHMEKNVHFIGVTRNVSAYYSAFDLMWLPSKYEGLPTVAIEAQSNGLPIIVSNKVTRKIDVNNVVFLPITNSKRNMNLWIEKTIENSKNRTFDLDKVFKNSIFEKNKVLEKWKNLYGLI